MEEEGENESKEKEKKEEEERLEKEEESVEKETQAEHIRKEKSVAESQTPAKRRVQESSEKTQGPSAKRLKTAVPTPRRAARLSRGRKGSSPTVLKQEEKSMEGRVIAREMIISPGFLKKEGLWEFQELLHA